MASDVDSILAYYNLPDGHRYQVFIQRINQVMNAGVVALVTKTAAPPPKNTLTPTQTELYLKMLQMSHLFQMTLAKAEIAQSTHLDMSGYGAIGFFVGIAINENQPKLDALAKEYLDDQPSFEAFTETKGSSLFLYRNEFRHGKIDKEFKPNSRFISNYSTKAQE
jgi:hypothetical protein